MRRERRRQDQSPRGAVAARAGAGPAPGGARGMRTQRRRRRLCALGRSRRGGRDASARHGLVAGGRRGRGRTGEPHRPRPRRVVARLLGPCAGRLADAGDGLAIFRARERAAPISRPVRAGDRSCAWRASRPVRARVARPQPAARGRFAQHLLARRDRARGGGARRRGRRGKARVREPARGADRGGARRRFAISLGAARASG